MAIGVSQGTELRFQGFFDISGNIFEKLIVIHRWLSSFYVVVQAGLETEKAPDGGWPIRRYVRGIIIFLARFPVRAFEKKAVFQRISV